MSSQPRHGFDVILGNPPWLSYTGRQKVAISDRQLSLLVDRFPEIARWPCSHAAFFVLQRDIVADGGRCGLVMPRQIADLDSFASVRSAVTSEGVLVQPVHDVGESAFPGVTQPVGLYCTKRTDAGIEKRDPWPVERARSEDSAQPGETHAHDPLPGVLRVVQDRVAMWPRFPPKTFSDPGVHTGNVSKKIILPTADEDLPCGRLDPVREGKDITHFFARPPRKWVWIDPELEDGEYCRIRDRDKYTTTPILLRQTANRPIATRHFEPTYFRNSLLACSGVDGLPDAVLVGFLNSTLYAFLHRARFIDSDQKAFPQVKIKHLHELPLPATPEGYPLPEAVVDSLRSVVDALETQAGSGDLSDSTMHELDLLVLRVFQIEINVLPLMKEFLG